MDIYAGDVRISMDSGEGAISFAAGQPSMDAGLENAIAISLFTSPAWWGNEPGEDIGSGVLSALAGNLSDANLKAAEDAARSGLDWLVSDGLASEVKVSCEAVDAMSVGLSVTITEPTTATATTKRYLINWAAERSHLEAQ